MQVCVKICGITNPADAELAASLGANMIGLNFYGQSPRCIDGTVATSILRVLPATVEPVALFVNESVPHIQQVVSSLGICTVQMHGDSLADPPAGLRWIPAFPVRDATSLQQITSYLDRCQACGVGPSAVLVDAHVPGQFGGTGQTAPWRLLADYKPGVPLILAGGLTPENVAEAIRIVHPFAVDVASGVECAPGRKDGEKMRRFIDAVRSVRG